VGSPRRRHIGKHLPGNPTVVPQNMPGAGSYVAASHIYGAAPKGRHVFAIIARGRGAGALEQRAGCAVRCHEIVMARQPDPGAQRLHRQCHCQVKTANALRDTELILGDTGPGTGTRSYPKVLNDLLGYKFKLVFGLSLIADVFLAMERGEVDGICESLDSINSASRLDCQQDGQRVAASRPESTPRAQGCANVSELRAHDEERQVLGVSLCRQDIGRPFVAPAELPPERLKVLRDALQHEMKDPSSSPTSTQQVRS
jgi:hypothetical protein